MEKKRSAVSVPFGILFIIIGLCIFTFLAFLVLSLFQQNISTDTKYMTQGFLVVSTPFCLLFLIFGTLLLKWRKKTVSLITAPVAVIIGVIVFLISTLNTVYYDKLIFLVLGLILLVSFGAIYFFIRSRVKDRLKCHSNNGSL